LSNGNGKKPRPGGLLESIEEQILRERAKSDLLRQEFLESLTPEEQQKAQIQFQEHDAQGLRTRVQGMEEAQRLRERMTPVEPPRRERDHPLIAMAKSIGEGPEAFLRTFAEEGSRVPEEGLARDLSEFMDMANPVLMLMGGASPAQIRSSLGKPQVLPSAVIRNQDLRLLPVPKGPLPTRRVWNAKTGEYENIVAPQIPSRHFEATVNPLRVGPEMVDSRTIFRASELFGPQGAKDVPKTLYHVSPRGMQARESRMLIARSGSGTGGMGNPRLPAVSFTPSKLEAVNMKETFQRANEISKVMGETPLPFSQSEKLSALSRAIEKEDAIKLLKRYAREDAKRGLPLDDLMGVIDDFSNVGARGSAGDPWLMFNTYLSRRAAIAKNHFVRDVTLRSSSPYDPKYRRFENIGLAGGPANYMNMDDLAIIAVPAKDIPGTTMVRQVRDVLDEIAVMGDVPLTNAKFIVD